jgi:hypothetical protein
VAEEAAQADAEPVEDPYDLGDTSLAGQYAEETPAQPRNPDGTFAKSSSAEGVTTAAPITTAPRHPSYLVEQARDFGWSDAEIDAMPTESLGFAVTRMHKQQRQLRDEMATQRTLTNPPPQQPRQQQIPSPPPPDDFDVNLDEDIVIPEIANAVKKVSAAAKKEINDLKERLARAEGREQERDNRELAEVLDGAFAALPPELRKFFGDKPGRDMTEADKKEWNRRLSILNQTGLNFKQSSRGTINAKVLELATDIYGPAVQTAKTAENPYGDVGVGSPGATNQKPAVPGRITQEQWDEAALAAPTHRSETVLPQGEELAKRNLAEKLRNRNGQAPRTSSSIRDTNPRPSTDQEIDDGLL